MLGVAQEVGRILAAGSVAGCRREGKAGVVVVAEGDRVEGC